MASTDVSSYVVALHTCNSSPLCFIPEHLQIMSSKWIPLVTINACVDFITSATVGLPLTLGYDHLHWVLIR